MPIGMTTTAEIEDFLRKLRVDGRALSGKSRNNYRGAIGTLFYFAESRGYVVWQLWNYADKNDGLWQCPSAVEDKAVPVSGDNSPLLGYMGYMFAIGVTASPLPEQQGILPKRLSSLINPCRAKQNWWRDVGETISIV